MSIAPVHLWPTFYLFHWMIAADNQGKSSCKFDQGWECKQLERVTTHINHHMLHNTNAHEKTFYYLISVLSGELQLCEI